MKRTVVLLAISLVAVSAGCGRTVPVEEWTVTVQLPVDDDQGRHLVNPSHDVLLDDILARLRRSRPAIRLRAPLPPIASGGGGVMTQGRVLRTRRRA